MIPEKPKPNAAPLTLGDYLRDIRVIQVVGQIIFVFLLVFVLAALWNNIFTALTVQRLLPNLEVLDAPSGFDISDGPDWYSTNSKYGKAFGVGIINSLRVVAVGLVMATLIGVLVGIFLLSRNWLIRNISRVYVEILRNTPLLVQIYFWYFIVMLSLPDFATASGIPAEGVYFIPHRVVAYIPVLLLVWWFSKRSARPGWYWLGALCGIGTLEILMRTPGWFGGARVDVVGGLALVLILWMISIFTKTFWREFGQSFVLTTLGAAILTGIFIQMVYIVGALESQTSLMQTRNYFVWTIDPAVYFTRRGIAFPELGFTPLFGTWMAFVIPGVILAIALWVIGGHVTETTGRQIRRGWLAVASIVGFGAIGWVLATSVAMPENIEVGAGDTAQTVPYEDAFEDNLLTPNQKILYSRLPLEIILPERGPGSFTRGTVISPNYAGLLLGLVIYTSAFIAEIVRAGIQAVPYGQIEAARALGLSYPQTLSRIILPQALRIIIPPLGNQYLNLAKNSSLAVAAAFADTYQIGQTVMNQSGQSVVGFTMIFVVYITMSLVISLVMNIVNSRFQLVTR
jgi:His/Glu/Gln/Arg/opine family amino acid ABC transporter permease subunit